MSDDPLDQALAAYTETRRAPRAPDSAATRTRLLRSLAVAERRARMRRWSALAVLVLASNATTWAWSSGRVERAVAAWRAPVASVASVASVEAGTVQGGPVAATQAAARLDTVVPAVAPEVVPAVAPAVVPAVAPAVAQRTQEPASPSAAAPPVIRKRGSGGASSAVGAASAVSAERTEADLPVAAGLDDGAAIADADTDADTDAASNTAATDTADREAFESAHRAHFEGGSHADALRAWDAYLARFPRGRFVPEAQFNRAIALLRLGRVDDARPALARIATGMYGAAHRDDARALLERLGAAE